MNRIYLFKFVQFIEITDFSKITKICILAKCFEQKLQQGKKFCSKISICHVNSYQISQSINQNNKDEDTRLNNLGNNGNILSQNFRQDSTLIKVL